MCRPPGINQTKQPVDAQTTRAINLPRQDLYGVSNTQAAMTLLPLTNEDRKTASGNFLYSFISIFLSISFLLLFFCSRYRPVLILEACQGALKLLLVLVLQVGQQHVLSAG